MNENIKVVHGTDFGVAPIYFYPHISGLLPTAPNGKEVLIAMKPSHTLIYDKQCVAGRQAHASVMWWCVCLLRLPCSPPCSFLYILHYNTGKTHKTHNLRIAIHISVASHSNTITLIVSTLPNRYRRPCFAVYVVHSQHCSEILVTAIYIRFYSL